MSARSRTKEGRERGGRWAGVRLQTGPLQGRGSWTQARELRGSFAALEEAPLLAWEGRSGGGARQGGGTECLKLCPFPRLHGVE